MTATPRETEVDGVKLDNLPPGAVRDVSASIATWLIAEGYAVPEMRSEASEGGAPDFDGDTRD